MPDQLISSLFSSKSEPALRTVLGWLIGSYVLALLIPVLIYSMLAVFNGIFDIELVIMMTVGFPISIFIDLQRLNIDIHRITIYIIGYGTYLFVAGLCVIFKNRARLLKIFMWTFWIMLLVNLISCVPKAVMLGIEQIH